MNIDKIALLELEATDHKGGLDRQKFAELIISECIATVQARYMGDNNREDMEVRRCVEALREKFGVDK